MKEIQYAGFLNNDILSTILLGETEGKIYLFNFGNFSKVRHYLQSITNEGNTIAYWVENRLHDENLDAFVTVNKIYEVNIKEVTDTTLHLIEAKNGSIGNEVICIEFTYLPEI